MNSTHLIRPIHPNDARTVYEIISHPAVAEMVEEVPSKEFEETAVWLNVPHAGQHRLAVEQDKKVVGYGTLTQFQNPRTIHSGKINLMVHPNHWREGIGTTLLVALLNIANNWLNLKRVEAEIFTHHEVAIHLFQKFNFITEGIQRRASFGAGKWLDAHVMARLRNVPEIYQVSIKRSKRKRGKRPLSTPINIRPVHQDDIPQLHQLFTFPEVSRTTLQLPSTEFSRIEERIRPVTPSRHRLVACSDNNIVGMISIRQLQNPRHMHIAHLGMMVHPDYWGIGIGSQLIAAILNLADNWLNIKRVQLEVHTDNPAAVHLYKKFGFVLEGTRTIQSYGDGRWADTHFMARIRD